MEAELEILGVIRMSEDEWALHREEVPDVSADRKAPFFVTVAPVPRADQAGSLRQRGPDRWALPALSRRSGRRPWQLCRRIQRRPRWTA